MRTVWQGLKKNFFTYLTRDLTLFLFLTEMVELVQRVVFVLF